MIKKIIISLTFILLIFTGCATVTPTGGAFTDSVVETSKSRLIIFRGGGSLLAKEIPAVNIFGAQPSIYNLPSNSFIQEDLVPGEYEIIVSKDKNSPGLVWRFEPIGTKINLIENKTTYLELEASTNLLIYTADITEVDEAYALGNLNSLNRVLNTDTAN